MSLTNLVVQQAKPEPKRYKLFDGGGLYLLVSPSGGKYWQLKYRLYGEKTYSIGPYPDVSLSEARDERQRIKSMLRSGQDPNALRQLEKREREWDVGSQFEVVAREWLEWRKSEITERYWRSIFFRFETYLFPTLGKRPVGDLRALDFLPIFRGIEVDGKLDLLQKLLQSCSGIMRFAVINGKAERDVTVDLRGAFRSPKRKNLARLREHELPEFFSRLNRHQAEEQTILAMKILIHTFVRTIELRGARWEEIDFERAEWTIPPERMKMDRPHLVPLTSQVLAYFRKQHEISRDGEFVFPIPFPKRNPFISENRLLYALYDLGYKGKATIHGFRGTASTILNEKEFNSDWIEMQLAHWNASSVRHAYNHAQYLPQRREMMQWYSDHLDSLETQGAALVFPQ